MCVCMPTEYGGVSSENSYLVVFVSCVYGVVDLMIRIYATNCMYI